jgi:hypothetical protein
MDGQHIGFGHRVRSGAGLPKHASLTTDPRRSRGRERALPTGRLGADDPVGDKRVEVPQRHAARTRNPTVPGGDDRARGARVRARGSRTNRDHPGAPRARAPLDARRRDERSAGRASRPAPSCASHAGRGAPEQAGGAATGSSRRPCARLASWTSPSRADQVPRASARRERSARSERPRRRAPEARRARAPLPARGAGRRRTARRPTPPAIWPVTTGRRHVRDGVKKRVKLCHRGLIGDDHVEVAAHAVSAGLDLDQAHLQGPFLAIEQRDWVIRRNVAAVPAHERVDALVGAAHDALGGDPRQAARRGASEPPTRTGVSRSGSSATVSSEVYARPRASDDRAAFMRIDADSSRQRVAASGTSASRAAGSMIAVSAVDAALNPRAEADGEAGNPTTAYRREPPRRVRAAVEPNGSPKVS